MWFNLTVEVDISPNIWVYVRGEHSDGYVMIPYCKILHIHVNFSITMYRECAIGHLSVKVAIHRCWGPVSRIQSNNEGEYASVTKNQQYYCIIYIFLTLSCVFYSIHIVYNVHKNWYYIIDKFCIDFGTVEFVFQLHGVDQAGICVSIWWCSLYYFL